MDILQALVLGLVQGATEFIPVSSSGHLVLVPWLLDWPAPSLAFDTMVHWGTLVAVGAYFWRTWRLVIGAWLRALVRWDWRDPLARLGWLLIIGTIPAAAVGYFLEEWFTELFSRPAWVSLFLVGTAGLLALSEWLGSQSYAAGGVRRLENLRWPHVLLIGLAQAAAIAPGISRSGTTMAMGLSGGVQRSDAARFSFLLSGPIIVVAGLSQLLDLASTPNPLAQVPVLAVGFVAAAVMGYLCIGGLLRYLQRGRLYPFAIYCACLGIACFVVSWLR
ncbi:MAG: undecaprenyl-diphosphate phosphatase [Anaerolineae bacterium]|jgi:undecaprenyl-diphosphatase